MSNEPLMDRMVEVDPGQFRQLGDCTRSDLEGAQAVAGEKALLHGQLAEALEQLGEHLGAEGTLTLTPDLKERLEHPPADLPGLRALARESRGLLVSVRHPKGQG